MVATLPNCSCSLVNLVLVMKPNPLASIKPINEKVAYHMVKDLAMADIATQFIGKSCADNSKPSSTREYEKAWGQFANTGVYSNSDVIMISGSGLWRGVSQSMVDEMFESHYIPLIDNAINSNVRGFVCGWANGIDSKVKEYLLSKGYSESRCKGFSKFKKINVGINILRHKDGYIGNPRIVYCGRPKSNKQWKLGNPFSWKRSQIARWVVKDISESLSKFKLFTWDLINERWDKFSPKDVEFAKQYWQEVKILALQIKRGEVDALTCFCGEWKNFTPVKGVPYECHAQILYAACLYMIEKEMV